MKTWKVSDKRNPQAGISWRKAATALCSLATLLGCLTLGSLSASAQNWNHQWQLTNPHPGVRKQADFNGDGYADLAIGVPRESYDWHHNGTGAGVVHVVYGSPGGLANGVNQLYSRRDAHSGSFYHPSNYASFGWSLAWGDFNKDGFDDLALGVPGDFGGEGTVEIYNGSSTGLLYYPSLRLHRTMMSTPLPPGTGSSTSFGNRLAVGDANGDGFADLAIVQQSDMVHHGGVYIVPGSATGLKPSTSKTWSWPGMGPSSLAFGDFNGDGYFDLAMGFPYHDVNYIYAGEVIVVYGTPYGLGQSVQFWYQDREDVAGIGEDYDYFGTSLVAADFNRDGRWDLAIGAPGENSNNGYEDGEGVVHILFGSPGGLVSWGQMWNRRSPGVYKDPGPNDRFGASLAAMDVDSDGKPELIVGIPGDNAGAGGIQVLTIMPGPLGIRHAFWNQDIYQVLDTAESGDRFGEALSVGDFNKDGRLDLAIGVPGENSNSGAINVLFGTSSGLSWPNNQLLMQGFQGLQETPEAGDRFGGVL
jgi:hypothetical protein